MVHWRHSRLVGRPGRHFFATIFLGSSIILVAMMFVWAAIVGAIFGSYTAYLLVNDDVIIFGFKLMSEIIGNYVVRMAGVFMLSIGSLWIRTGAAPRWLTVITYIVALGFLIPLERRDSYFPAGCFW